MNKVYRGLIDKIVETQANRITNGEGIIPGHNGPYYDMEMLGRNTSHWIIIFCSYFLNTKIEKYKDCVEILSDYYFSQKDKSESGVYYCREKKGSGNYINGTIGAAWIIEGMLSAYRILKDERLLNSAIDLFNQFPFDEKNGMWEMIEVDGTNLGLDITYNHQLWFAASGAEILEFVQNDKIEREIVAFLNKSNKTFLVLNKGLICHFANCYTSSIQKIKNILKYYKHRFEIRIKKPSLEYKEIGYHMFDLYGFAIIYRRFKEHPFFQTSKFKSALAFINNSEYMNKLYNLDSSFDGTNLICNNTDNKINSYAFPYNSPAFELPFISESFEINNKDMQEKMMEYQFTNTYDNLSERFSRNTEDSEVLTARIYELINSDWFWGK